MRESSDGRRKARVKAVSADVCCGAVSGDLM